MEMRKFKFTWIDGKEEIGQGITIAHAFANLGYGNGAAKALDRAEEIKD